MVVPIPKTLEHKTAERSKYEMFSTCICFDAFLTVEGRKTFHFESDGKEFTSYIIHPSQHVVVYACYHDDTPRCNNPRFRESAYTFAVAHIFISVLITIRYDVTCILDDDFCTGDIDVNPAVHLCIRGHVAYFNGNRLEQEKGNPCRLDFGESGETHCGADYRKVIRKDNCKQDICTLQQNNR